MRVAPLKQYQLVDIKPDPVPDLQLASTNNRLLHGCTSCICFGRAAVRVETPCHLKVGPTKQEPQPHDDLRNSPDSEKVNKTYTSDLDLDLELDDVEDKNGVLLKSSLKRPTTSVVASVAVNGGECKNECGDTDTERRKVQWTDVFGGELFEIREFEPSEHDDDESESWNEGKCSCKIM